MWELDDLLDPDPPSTNGLMALPEWPTATATVKVPDRWARTLVGQDAVLTPAEVVDLIGGREGVVREWCPTP